MPETPKTVLRRFSKRVGSTATKVALMSKRIRIVGDPVSGLFQCYEIFKNEQNDDYATVKLQLQPGKEDLI